MREQRPQERDSFPESRETQRRKPQGRRTRSQGKHLTGVSQLSAFLPPALAVCPLRTFWKWSKDTHGEMGKGAERLSEEGQGQETLDSPSKFLFYTGLMILILEF